MERPLRTASRRRGAALVEFAVCAPILLMMVFGIIEFSRALQLQQTARQAAFEGARAGIAIDSVTDDAFSAARTNLAALGIADAQITVSPNPLLYTSPNITVTVAAKPSTSGWLLNFFNKSSVITSSITLSREVTAISAPGIANPNAAPSRGTPSGGRDDDDDDDDDREHEGDDREHEGDDREHEGDDREHEGDDREHEGDDREHEGDDREHEGDDREHEGDDREHEGDDREHESDDREHEGDDREHEGDDREHEDEGDGRDSEEMEDDRESEHDDGHRESEGDDLESEGDDRESEPGHR